MHIVTLLKRAAIVIALVVLVWIPFLNAATDGSSTEGTVNTLLTAIASNNYNALIANAAPALKSKITKETFTQVSTQLSPRLKKGYKLQYLGQSQTARGRGSFVEDNLSRWRGRHACPAGHTGK